MTAFDAYKMYVALKLHFTSDNYDFFKFKGKTRTAKESSFEKRKDKLFFKKLTIRLPEKEIQDYFVANFVDGSNSWIGYMVDDEGSEIYSKWKKRIESLHYTFSEDVDFLLSQTEDFDELFYTRGTHPPLLRYYLGKKICLETLCILDKILAFSHAFDNDIEETLVWPSVKNKVCKYSAFLDIDLVKYRETLKEKVLDHRCLFSNQS